MFCTFLVFASLTRMLEEVPAGIKEEWDTLYIGTNIYKTVGMKVDDADKAACSSESPVHPLLYQHPRTGKQVRTDEYDSCSCTSTLAPANRYVLMSMTPAPVPEPLHWQTGMY